MAFWKLKAWLHHWLGKAITIGIIVGAVLIALFFRDKAARIWERIYSAMTFDW